MSELKIWAVDFCEKNRQGWTRFGKGSLVYCKRNS